MSDLMQRFIDPAVKRVFIALIVFYCFTVTVLVLMQRISVDDWSGKFLGGLALLGAMQIPSSTSAPAKVDNVAVEGDQVTVTEATE